MTLRENLSFTRRCIADAMFAGTVELHAKVARVLTPPAEKSLIWKAKRLGAVSLGLFALPLTASAVALADACSSGGSTDSGTSGLVSLFQTIGTIIIAIGGAAFLVTLGVGALMIMAAGGNSQRADKGMAWIKNSVIGVGLLAFGIFIRSIVVHVVANMTDAVHSNQSSINGNDSSITSCLDNSKYGSGTPTGK